MPIWINFAIWTYLLSVPFYLLISRDGGASGKKFSQRFRLLLWVPGLVALGFRLLTGIGFSDIQYSLTSWWLLFAAVALPLLVEVILIAITIRAGWGQLSKDILVWKDGKVQIGEKLGILGKERTQTPLRFGANLGISLLIGSVYTALFAIGSELGWRAFLQPLTIQPYGLTMGMVLVGLIWGYWLLPIVLAGYRFPSNPRLGAWILMPATAIAYSLIAGFLYIASENIWAPALFHASLIVSGDLSEVGLGKAGGSLTVRLVSIALWYLVALVVGLFLRQS